MKYQYSRKYTGGDNNALTDGKISIKDVSGTKNHEIWQGFEGVDLIATIDLKKETDISHISAGFLQKTDAWLFADEIIVK